MARKILNGLDLNAQKIQNMADPSTGTDSATKQYVDNKVEGLAYKDEVRVATTTNGALATAYANGQTIDGVVLATEDRVLLKDQTAQAENGIYTVNASGAPTRAGDANSASDLNNATVYVTDGTVNSGREYTQSTKNPNPGVSNVVFAQKTSGVTPTSGSGAISVAGAAVSFVPKAGGFLAQDGSGAYLDTTAAAAKLITKYVQNIGDGSTNPIIVTHNLGTKDRAGAPLVTLVSTGELVEPDIIVGINTDTVTFPSAPTSAQYRYSTAA
jgi:hypothetical protein